uniref:protein-L-isoaspartate(D-aspartate) O-methyltransferase n=2 Tax=Cacopsylla melanoneura TaxID=428564 RepID=A0A8D8Q8Q5_9HEMI
MGVTKWCFICLLLNNIRAETPRTTSDDDDVALRPVTSNEEFIQWLKSENLLKCDKLEKVLHKVDILHYVPPDKPCFLLDIQTQLEYGAYIEHPSLILTYLSLIEPHLKPNSRVLEIGSGSGYLTNLISELMNCTGQVIGVEHVPSLVNSSIQNILHSNPRLLMNGHIKFVVMDGRRGYAKKAPYDIILMSASTPHLSSSIVDQLKPGGRLIIPLGEPDDVQNLCTIEKFENGTLQKTVITRGSFAYIASRDEQMETWTNGTRKSQVNTKQRAEMLSLLAELAKEETVIDEKQKIKDLFESAKFADVDKKVESYERECKQAELFEETTKHALPYALEEIMHQLRTAPTKRTRKRKLTTGTTDKFLMW